MTSLPKKKLLILGHSGFIGSNLERMLSASGRWNVIGHSLPDVDLTDPTSASQLKPYFTSDATLILAAAVKRQFGDTLLAFRQNMAIIENVCQLLQDNPISHVVFFSSAAVYGEETENTSIDEQTVVQPESYYGINKFTAECLLRKICRGKGTISLTCLRPPLIYGAGDQGATYGPAGFLAAASEGSRITLWGDGTELREFIYVDDVCRAVEQLAEQRFDGVLNLVSGHSHSFLDVVSIIRKYFPKMEIDMRPRSKRKVDNAFIATKIRSLLPLGFEFTPLDVGVAKMLGRS